MTDPSVSQNDRSDSRDESVSEPTEVRCSDCGLFEDFHTHDCRSQRKAAEITITLPIDVAQWLRDEMGDRPVGEHESGVVYDVLLERFAARIKDGSYAE